MRINFYACLVVALLVGILYPRTPIIKLYGIDGATVVSVALMGLYKWFGAREKRKVDI